MNPASPPLAWPGGRVLAGWWRQLAPYRPESLWVAHLLLHHVEALVRVAQPISLDPFAVHVLRALALSVRQTAGDLDRRLHLGAPVVLRLLAGLAAEGLAAGEPGAGWAVTDAGRRAVTEGRYARPRHERRTFHFVEGGPPEPAPRFLNLTGHACTPWPAGEGWAFDPHALAACVGRPAAWKERHGFPPDVEEVVGLDAAAPAVPPWQRVMLDRPERMSAALVHAAGEDGGRRLLGFAFRQEGWALETDQPAFALGAGWEEVLPDLAEEPPVEAWRQAWLAWSQPRALPPADTAACRFER